MEIVKRSMVSRVGGAVNRQSTNAFFFFFTREITFYFEHSKNQEKKQQALSLKYNLYFTQVVDKKFLFIEYFS